MFYQGLLANTFGKSVLIKSIQTVEITIPLGGNSNTATINPVNTGSTMLLFQGFRMGTNSGYAINSVWPLITLTNSTTITASTRNTNASSTRIVCITVVEFYPQFVKYLGYFSSGFGSGFISTTTTIPSVNVNNTALFWCGCHSSTGGNIQDAASTVTLTNSTTVTTQRGSTSANGITTNFGVIEFYSGVLKSIQPTSANIAVSQLTGDSSALSTPVNMDNSLSLWNGYRIASGSTSNSSIGMAYGKLVSSTIFRATRRTASASVSVTANASILEFNPGYVKSKISGVLDIPDTLSTNSVTLPSVNTNKSMLSWLGQTGNSVATLKLTSPTNLQADRVDSSGIESESWALAEFY